MMIIDVCFTLIFILYHQFCCVKLIVAIVLCLIVIDMTNRIVLISVTFLSYNILFNSYILFILYSYVLILTFACA